MKDEAAFRAAVLRAWKETYRAFIRKLPAEGFAGRGTPDDITCFEGKVAMVEHKYVPAWPKRPQTKIPIELTPDQLGWLIDWRASGGRGFVLLGVEHDWFLLRLFELAAFNQYGLLELPFKASQDALRKSLFRGTTTRASLRTLPRLVAQISAEA